MPALFPPGANAVYRLALAAGLFGLAAAICLPMIFIRTPYAANVDDAIAQPIAFDHRHHARDDGIDCVYCHQSVETQAAAGMPSSERCMGCHAQIWPDSSELAPLRETWRTGEPIRWKRVNAVPDFVYFHHGVHVQAGVACARCHGDIANMPRVRRVHRMTMDFCLECHRERSGGRAISRITTCTACHR
jgi:hypothetical protein